MILPTHNIGWAKRTNRFKQAILFIAKGFRIRLDRSVHGQKYQNLQQMVLDNVANRSHFLVKAATPLHAEIFSQCDLHAGNVVSVPDGFKKRIGKAEIKQVLNRLLSEKM